MSKASLKFLKQTSLSVDRFCDNGIEKRLHYVIKNNEFQILVELPEDVQNATFNDLLLEAQLLYDCSPKPKEVLQVRQKPFKYKGAVETGDLRKCCLQVSISILSSQHEDMNFVLFLQAKNTKTGEVLASGYSDPVQVISKPDVLRKKREPKKKKRTWNDRVTELLERIEAKQTKHDQMLSQISANQISSDPFADLFSVHTPSAPVNPFHKFERAYCDLVSAYREMEPLERPAKIRKLVQSNPGDLEDVSSLFSCFQSSLPASSPATDSSSPLKKSVQSFAPLMDDLDLNNLVSELFSVEGAF